MRNYKEIYQAWLNKIDMDKELHDELLTMDEKCIKESFYKNVDFGTGGIRAKMGAGTNKLNIYTVRKCAQGYAQWLLKQSNYDSAKYVLIAYDNRRNANTFTSEIVAILSKYKIKSAVFKGLRPTPELSYAIRKMGAVGGIVITASHNTKEYNGIKMYDETGCQCTEDYTKAIKEEINKIEDALSIETASMDEIKQHHMIIEDKIDQGYIQESLSIALGNENYENLKVIYTPQHGAGVSVIPQALKQLGVNYKLVDRQSVADPDFTYTETPNPENSKSFNEALKVAVNFNADIIIGTDPDCDRIGAMVLHNQEYIQLTGNQLGVIMLDYIFSTNKKGYVYSTIVTTPMVEKICKINGVKHIQTLTGFKNIGSQMNQHEGEFLIAIEESNGYLVKDNVRDKDGLQATLYTLKIANYYKSKGQDLISVLDRIYQKYGFMQEKQQSISLEGEVGTTKVDFIMNTFRQYKEKLGSYTIYKVEDYKTSISYHNGKEQTLDFAKSNVLKIYFDEFSWIAIRPSGTEPKIKFYYCIEMRSNAEYKLDDLIKTIQNIIQ